MSGYKVEKNTDVQRFQSQKNSKSKGISFVPFAKIKNEIKEKDTVMVVTFSFVFLLIT